MAWDQDARHRWVLVRDGDGLNPMICRHIPPFWLLIRPYTPLLNYFDHLNQESTFMNWLVEVCCEDANSAADVYGAKSWTEVRQIIRSIAVELCMDPSELGVTRSADVVPFRGRA